MKDNSYKIGIYDTDGINLNPLNGKPYSNEYKDLTKFWKNLPAYESIDKSIKSVKNNDVILVSSGTGSGKTVLFPKFVLHAYNYTGKIIVTLPKKIITQYAAEFSAKTLDVTLGEQVGYQFKGEAVKSAKTILLYSTDGSIISMIKSDPLIKDVDAVIIDEAHERSTQIDILLFLLKNAIKIRKEKGMNPLKLIIMSATIDEKIFKKYYSDFNFDFLFLSGKPNYPIESYFLEKSILKIVPPTFIKMGSTILLETVKKINSGTKENGDILFFVTSHAECIDTVETLSKEIKDSFIMALYSGCFNKLPELKQYVDDKEKYKELNPNYKRRIFIATNVAESSLTIDGIVYVIDSGLEFSRKYDAQKKINIMDTALITKAQMLQRRGRAGRTKNGYCYHLYTKEEMDNTEEFPDPEIKIIDLKNLCLSLLKLGQDLYNEFTAEDTIKMFNDFIQPPLPLFIKDGIDFDTNYGLIGSDGKITELGKLVNESRMDVMDALSLLYAYNYDIDIFDKVLLIICIYSRINSIKELFFQDLEKDDDKDNQNVKDKDNQNVKDKDNQNVIDDLIKDIMKNSLNSEHILLMKIHKKFIKNENNNKIFNISLINIINNDFDKLYKKLHSIFHSYRIKVNTVDFDKNDKKIIACFNYGFKENMIHNKNNKIYFNNILCDTVKSVVDTNKITDAIFYSNVSIRNKLYVSIISPFIL